MSELEQLLDWVKDLYGEALAFQERAAGAASEDMDAWNQSFDAWLKSDRAVNGLWRSVRERSTTQLMPMRLRAVFNTHGDRLRHVVHSPQVMDPLRPTFDRARLKATLDLLGELSELLETAIQMSSPPPPTTEPAPTPQLAAPSDDRIVRLQIAGLRSIESLDIDLDGLRVLIGENGAGKSSIVEACELLSRAPGRNFMETLDRQHGGVRALLRHGAEAVELKVSTGGSGGPLTYAIKLGLSGLFSAVMEERLERGPHDGKGPPLVVLERRNGSARVFDQRNGQHVVVAPPSGLLLSVANQLPGNAAITRMIDALTRIQVHVPFFSSPSWVTTRMGGEVQSARQPNLAQQTDRVERFAANLSNAYLALRNDVGRWNEALDLVRLGLGYDVEDIVTPPLAGGQIVMEVKFSTWDRAVPLAGLSDGQVAYLAFVAMVTLPATFSLLVFDEVEQHMHPGLLVRVLGLFETLAERGPVVLTTHSDRLLDAVDDPAACVRVLELDDERRTRLLKCDADKLATWLEKYRGLGELRAIGLDQLVMVDAEGAP